MKHFVCMQIFVTSHPLAELYGHQSVSQSDSEVGTTAGGWPGLGARVGLGDRCGSPVPNRKIRDDEACGSQTMKRHGMVATIEKAFLKATVELEASLSTRAVAGSQVSRVERESRSRVEEL
jgi:hypothetical protein